MTATLRNKSLVYFIKNNRSVSFILERPELFTSQDNLIAGKLIFYGLMRCKDYKSEAYMTLVKNWLGAEQTPIEVKLYVCKALILRGHSLGYTTVVEYLKQGSITADQFTRIICRRPSPRLNKKEGYDGIFRLHAQRLF